MIEIWTGPDWNIPESVIKECVLFMEELLVRTIKTKSICLSQVRNQVLHNEIVAVSDFPRDVKPFTFTDTNILANANGKIQKYFTYLQNKNLPNKFMFKRVVVDHLDKKRYEQVQCFQTAQHMSYYYYILP